MRDFELISPLTLRISRALLCPVYNEPKFRIGPLCRFVATVRDGPSLHLRSVSVNPRVLPVPSPTQPQCVYLPASACFRGNVRLVEVLL